MRLESEGVALAFMLAGISLGTWAAFVTLQLRSHSKKLRLVAEQLEAIVDGLGLRAHVDAWEHDADYRNSRRLLDDSSAGIRFEHR